MEHHQQPQPVTAGLETTQHGTDSMNRNFVGIPTGRTIYIGVADREEFDIIDRPMTDHSASGGNNVLTKSVEQDSVMVVFQHWIE